VAPRPIAIRREAAQPSGLAIGLYRRPQVRAYAVLTGVAFCGEMLIAQWIGLYLRDERGYAESSGAIAVIVLSGAMFVGRLLNGPVTVKAGPRTALVAQGLLMAVGAAGIVGLSGVVPIAIACGVTGIGLAGVGPTALSLAGKAVPDSPGAASGAALIGGYVGLAATPFIAGLVVSIASVRAVLAGELLFAAIVLGVAYWMGRQAMAVPSSP
jgi:predicted MFS family arabinose efflux permease